jgi:short-subunit dehydrogenase
MKQLKLNEITALISGGNKGIGLAISERLIKHGVKVISLGRSKFEKKINNISNFDELYFHYQCDISNFDELKKVLSEIMERHGHINLLVNNAGISDFTTFATSDISLGIKMIDVNLSAAIALTHSILPAMLADHAGVIINMSSVAAIENFADCSVYNASKAGLLSFSRTLRKEVRKSGVKVIDVLPGATLTDIWDEDFRTTFKDKMMHPEDIAEAVFECIRMSLNPRLMIEEIILTPQAGSL